MVAMLSLKPLDNKAATASIVIKGSSLVVDASSSIQLRKITPVNAMLWVAFRYKSVAMEGFNCAKTTVTLRVRTQALDQIRVPRDKANVVVMIRIAYSDNRKYIIAFLIYASIAQ